MLLKTYNHLVTQNRFREDPKQLRLVELLSGYLDDRRFFRWPRRSKQGVYIYGSVGTGKSMLMDMFYRHLPSQFKQRFHFSEFMNKMHRERYGDALRLNSVTQLCNEFAKKCRTLCLDEFQVEDIGDAMMLRNVLSGLFKAKVSIFTTSNRKPADLFMGGSNRVSFLPAINLIERYMDVFALDGSTDYRRVHGKALSLPQSKEQLINDFYQHSTLLVKSEPVPMYTGRIPVDEQSFDACLVDFTKIASHNPGSGIITIWPTASKRSTCIQSLGLYMGTLSRPVDSSP